MEHPAPVATFRILRGEDVPDAVADRYPGSVFVLWRSRESKRPWLVRVEHALVGGILECVALEIRSIRIVAGEVEWPVRFPSWETARDKVSATLYRDLQVRALLDFIAADVAKHNAEWADWLEELDPEGAEQTRLSVQRSTRPRIGTPPLREIADVYLAAKKLQQPTTRAVAKHWDVSPRTADNWIGKARKDKFLPPATTGRPKQPKGPRT